MAPVRLGPTAAAVIYLLAVSVHFLLLPSPVLGAAEMGPPEEAVGDRRVHGRVLRPSVSQVSPNAFAQEMSGSASSSAVDPSFLITFGYPKVLTSCANAVRCFFC